MRAAACAELSKLKVGAETRGVSFLGAEPPGRKEFELWRQARDAVSLEAVTTSSRFSFFSMMVDFIQDDLPL